MAEEKAFGRRGNSPTRSLVHAAPRMPHEAGNLVVPFSWTALFALLGLSALMSFLMPSAPIDTHGFSGGALLAIRIVGVWIGLLMMFPFAYGFVHLMLWLLRIMGRTEYLSCALINAALSLPILLLLFQFLPAEPMYGTVLGLMVNLLLAGLSGVMYRAIAGVEPRDAKVMRKVN